MSRGGSTRQYRAKRAALLRASTVCHICGHEGSDSADHVTAVANGGTDHPSNLRPAHHNRCPTCGRRCNLEKSDQEWAPIVRRSGSLT